jgi:hypothetical protein
VVRHASDAGEQKLLDEIEEHLQLWQAVTAGLPATHAARGEWEALRMRLLDCWRYFARLDLAGGAVAPHQLRHLAELEAAANIVVPDATLSLLELAQWMVERLARIRANDGSPSFAARVMHARIETRPGIELATAAVLVAPVICDEGYATEQLGEQEWRDAITIAEQIPIVDRLSRVERVLSGADGGSCEDDGDAQAILRGLTACHGAGAELSLRDWLAGVIRRSEWRDALAPIVIHGLLQADSTLLEMCAPYRDRLSPGLLSYTGNSGLLRSEAFQMSRRFAGYSARATQLAAFVRSAASITERSQDAAVVKPDSKLVTDTLGTASIPLLMEA